MTRRIVAIAGLLVLTACGGLPDVVTDTGYEGTWQRGNERVKSILSIVQIDGEYKVRWTRTATDHTTKVSCDWDGACEEFIEGMKTSEYRFRAWVDDERGNLRLECTGHVFEPDPVDVHYIDELIVTPRGDALRSFTLLDANGTYAFKKGPHRRLSKISDYVVDPPKGWHPKSAG